MSASRFVSTAALLVMGAACLAPTMSRAQQTPAAGDAASMPSFEQLDKANHGYLTRGDIPKDVESLKSLRMHLADSDTNGNGRIEKSEYQAYVARSQPNQAAGGDSTPRQQPMQH
jgi:hypothetical protein